MRTLKLIIAYDGTRYAGWQVQSRPQTTDHRPQKKQKQTIQGTIERVLKRILQEPVRVIGSGRTDSGVHAQAQVAHVKISSSTPTEKIFCSLNQLLPRDIGVMRIEEAKSSFHAQFQAKRKTYRYHIYTGPTPSPFISPFVYHVRHPLNISRMRGELRAVKGKHDFKAFSRASSKRETTVRIIYEARLKRLRDDLYFDFIGNGFLHTMVRSLAGTLIDIGRGRLPQGTMRRILRHKKREEAGTTAPAQGLTLIHVAY